VNDELQAKYLQGIILRMTNQTPHHYEIRIAGHLGSSLSQTFEGLATRFANGDMILSGTLVDQAALYGVLLKLRDLGLELISVNRVERIKS
jgi:hypothetical protein